MSSRWVYLTKYPLNNIGMFVSVLRRLSAYGLAETEIWKGKWTSEMWNRAQKFACYCCTVNFYIESVKVFRTDIKRNMIYMLHKKGLLNNVCGVGNFGKIWHARRYHDIHCSNGNWIRICIIICIILSLYFSICLCSEKYRLLMVIGKMYKKKIQCTVYSSMSPFLAHFS